MAHSTLRRTRALSKQQEMESFCKVILVTREPRSPQLLEDTECGDTHNLLSTGKCVPSNVVSLTTLSTRQRQTTIQT